jgi:ATP phosphoribosyltransferase regulatory subunit HisZ
MDLRLKSMSRSLESVILPAIDSENALAVTQAHIIIAHIGLIRRLLDHLPEYGRLEHRANLAVAVDLASVAEGGPAVETAVLALRSQIAAAPGDGALASAAELRDSSEALARAAEAVVDAMGVDGDAGARKRVIDIAIKSLGETARRELRWFDATQDPEALLSEWRSNLMEGALR